MPISFANCVRMKYSIEFSRIQINCPKRIAQHELIFMRFMLCWLHRPLIIGPCCSVPHIPRMIYCFLLSFPSIEVMVHTKLHASFHVSAINYILLLNWTWEISAKQNPFCKFNGTWTVCVFMNCLPFMIIAHDCSPCEALCGTARLALPRTTTLAVKAC